MFVCPSCGGQLVLTTTTSGKYLYCCQKKGCDGYMMCSQETKAPSGPPSNMEVRRMRAECHYRFDSLWKGGYLTRRGAYIWLSHRLGLSEDDAHIGKLDTDMCKKLIILVESLHGSLPKAHRKYRRKNG
jgi:hypothetical protein